MEERVREGGRVIGREVFVSGLSPNPAAPNVVLTTGTPCAIASTTFRREPEPSRIGTTATCARA
jgi:hypothetical protein